MARSTKKSPSADEPSGSAHLGEIQSILTKTRIAPDLLAGIEAARPRRTAKSTAAKPPMFDVIIEFNRSFPGGIITARLTLLSAYEKAHPAVDLATAKYREALAAGPLRDDADLVKAFEPDDKVAVEKSLWTDNYVFARLSLVTIQRLSAWTLAVPGSGGAEKRVPLVYKIWRDHRITRCVYKSAQTIKCDAAGTTFGATGKGIVWAVADTGIDQTHPHFRLLGTTKLEDGLRHKDFTQEHPDEQASEAAALIDQDGHGTHVAGIIAGFTSRKQDNVPGIESGITRITLKFQERADNAEDCRR
jgi:serine protease AprX